MGQGLLCKDGGHSVCIVDDRRNWGGWLALYSSNRIEEYEGSHLYVARYLLDIPPTPVPHHASHHEHIQATAAHPPTIQLNPTTQPYHSFAPPPLLVPPTLPTISHLLSACRRLPPAINAAAPAAQRFPPPHGSHNGRCSRKTHIVEPG